MISTPTLIRSATSAFQSRVSLVSMASLSLLLIGAQYAHGVAYYPTVVDVSTTPPHSSYAQPYMQPTYAPATVRRSSSVRVAQTAAVPARYQTLPGFQCFYWSPQGDCLNYSYYNFDAVAPSAIYPAAPIYRAPISSRSTINDLTVRVTGSPDPVQIGDTITYSIYVKNNANVTQTTDVLAELDDNVTFISASSNGDDIRNNEVEWNNVHLRVRDSVTLTLRVRVNSRARNGDDILLRVDADNASDEKSIRIDDRYNSSNCYDQYGSYNSNLCNNRSSSNNCYDRYGRYDRDLCDDSYGDDDNCYDRYGRYDRDLCDDRYDDDDSCYDRYGRYDRDLCDDDYEDDCYDRYGDYDSSLCRNSGDLSIVVTDSPDPIRSGNLLTYTIDLRSSNTNYRRFDVRAELDSDTTFFTASDGGNISSRDQVIWRDITVNRNTNRRLTLTVRADSVRAGDTLRLYVSADGERDDETTYVQY